MTIGKSAPTNGMVTQQLAPDCGIMRVAYTLTNPLVHFVAADPSNGNGGINAPLTVSANPTLGTSDTDPLGNKTACRFDTRGFSVGSVRLETVFRLFAGRAASVSYDLNQLLKHLGGGGN